MKKDLYKGIEHDEVVDTLTSLASILNSRSKAHIFCQRAVNTVTESRVSVNGKMNEPTISAINDAEGLVRPLCFTAKHYAVCYIESRTHPSEYSEFMRKIW